MSRLETWGLASVVLALGCQSHVATPADGRTCEERRAHLMEVLSQLPEEGLAAPVTVGLPSSTLSGTFGKGSIIELSGERVAVNGVALQGQTLAERLTELRAQVASMDPAQPVYLAAAWDFQVGNLQPYLEAIPEQFTLKLLFSVPPVPKDAGQPEPAQPGMHLAARVLAERDVAKRHALANQGYDDYAACPAVESAAAGFSGLNARERWPGVRRAMLDALPQCQCEDIDADALRQLLVAEQRAGTVSLGSIPASYLRDRRCSAAMPLDSIQQLLDEIDEFDAEFSGDWKEDALVFDKVVTDERLLVYMCVALPGETLAWVARNGGAMYLRPPGSNQCQEWRMEPIARGAPMGTWRRVGGEPLAVHYRQGASEIRLFGPTTSPQSKPTDDEPWGCDETFKMDGAESHWINLEKNGRWYYDRASCEAAPIAEAKLAGCIGDLAAGIAPPPKEEKVESEGDAPAPPAPAPAP